MPDATPPDTPAPSSHAAPRPRFRLEPLTAAHDVGDFSCGDDENARVIAEYLKTQALAEHTAGLNSVTVMVDVETGAVAGFFTLSPLSIPISPAVLAALGLAGAPYRSVGGYLLGRLGVDAALQGLGIGAALATRALAQARQGREDGLGGAFVAVDAKDERLVAWYTALGFQRLDPAKRRVVRSLR